MSSASSKPIRIGRECACQKPSWSRNKIDHCCQLNECLSGKRSLHQIPSTQNGLKIFSSKHRQMLTVALLSLDSTMNWTHVIDATIQYIHVGDGLGDYMANTYGECDNLKDKCVCQLWFDGLNAKEIQVRVSGAGHAGKSALIIRYLTCNFVEDYDPTIEDIFKKRCNVNGCSVSYEIDDSCSMEFF